MSGMLMQLIGMSIWVRVMILWTFCAGQPSSAYWMFVQVGASSTSLAETGSRRLAKLGFEVEAFDFSTAMIEIAIKRTDEFSDKIRYQVLDATSETDLLQLGGGEFEGAISNMALFDMAEIAPLFRALSQLLHPDGCHA